MGTKKKADALPAKTRTPLEVTLGKNVSALLEHHYAGVPYRFQKKHKKSVVLSRIQHVAETGGCTIATLGRVAAAFDLKPYQLLIPELDVKNPQVAVKAREAKAIKQLIQGDNSSEEVNNG